MLTTNQDNPDMEINTNQHPDSIWTWHKLHGKKFTLWIPYLNHFESKKKNIYSVHYNGGEFTFDVRDVDCLMLYGASGILPVGLLDDLASNGAILLLHRRNMPHPYALYPSVFESKNDVLTRQILARENASTSAYIARTLIRERFHGFERFGLAVAESTFAELAKLRSVKLIRQLEAQETKRFWARYFGELGIDISRRDNHPVIVALDAGSFFMHGIGLRWLLAHKFSPAHGYLHEPTRYTSLVYDVLEPYRYLIEMAVMNAWKDSGEESLTARTIENIKVLLDEAVYCHETRQTVRRKSLLHGVVLALRSYLIGDTKRFVVPTEGERIGGRPLKLAFSMPGPK